MKESASSINMTYFLVIDAQNNQINASRIDSNDNESEINSIVEYSAIAQDTICSGVRHSSSRIGDSFDR